MAAGKSGGAKAPGRSEHFEIIKPSSQTEGSVVPSASRSAPPKIKPIIRGGIYYEAPWHPQGTLIVKEYDPKAKKPGKELWRLPIIDDYIDPILERDVQEVWFAKMELSKDGKTMTVTDEVGRVYVVDLEKRTFVIPNWEVTTQIVEWRPGPNGWKYWVELRIHNGLNRPILLDRESVAATTELANDLFRVTVDGKKVAYMGSMKKRAPPDPSEFIRLGPGETYRREIEISEQYPVPAGDRKVLVGFEHTNHFSPDGFVMSTYRPDERQFSGEGHNIRPSSKPKPPAD